MVGQPFLILIPKWLEGAAESTYPTMSSCVMGRKKQGFGLLIFDDKVALARALDAAGLTRIEFLLTTPGSEEGLVAKLQDMGLKHSSMGQVDL